MVAPRGARRQSSVRPGVDRLSRRVDRASGRASIDCRAASIERRPASIERRQTPIASLQARLRCETSTAPLIERS
jgi:hypothetical protein